MERRYVTSARLGLQPAALRLAPLSGGLFVLDAGVPGTSVGTFGRGVP